MTCGPSARTPPFAIGAKKVSLTAPQWPSSETRQCERAMSSTVALSSQSTAKNNPFSTTWSLPRGSKEQTHLGPGPAGGAETLFECVRSVRSKRGRQGLPKFGQTPVWHGTNSSTDMATRLQSQRVARGFRGKLGLISAGGRRWLSSKVDVGRNGLRTRLSCESAARSSKIASLCRPCPRHGFAAMRIVFWHSTPLRNCVPPVFVLDMNPRNRREHTRTPNIQNQGRSPFARSPRTH